MIDWLFAGIFLYQHIRVDNLLFILFDYLWTDLRYMIDICCKSNDIKIYCIVIILRFGE